jgi:hypothetical protein
LRDHLTEKKTTLNDSIPIKLLYEISSLPSFKFRIEVRSKLESLVLPFKSASNEEEEEQQENKEFLSSPLDNDYVTLNCKIINKKLPLVPPIRIFVPYSYPELNPFVDCIQLDNFDDDMLPEYSKKN